LGQHHLCPIGHDDSVIGRFGTGQGYNLLDSYLKGVDAFLIVVENKELGN
jgi:hypothetical protein